MVEARCVEALAPVLAGALFHMTHSPCNPCGHEGIEAVDHGVCHAVLDAVYARASNGPAEAPPSAMGEELVGEAPDEEVRGRGRAGVGGKEVEEGRHAAGVMHPACIPVASLLADLVRPNDTGLVCPNDTGRTAPEGVVFFSPHPCNPPCIRGGGAWRAAADDAGGSAASLVQAVRAAVLFLQRVHAQEGGVHGDE